MTVNILSPENKNGFPVINSDQLLNVHSNLQNHAWRICISDPFINCAKVHPRQQKKVAHILSVLRNDRNVQKVVLFGSSLERRCHVDSDVDIYLELNSNTHVKMPVCDFPFDLWTNYTVNEKLEKEIEKKGVVVYERDTDG